MTIYNGGMMNSSEIDHNERYKQMVKEVDSRAAHWCYGSDPKLDPKYITLTAMMQTSAGLALPVGPFPFDYFDGDFLGIPNYRFNPVVEIPESTQVDLAIVATNALTTNILRTAWGTMLESEAIKGKNAPSAGFMALCVQTTVNSNGDTVVVAADLYSILRPHAYYEYPPGYRLVLAMSGNLVPEQSALVFRCEVMQSKKHHLDIINDMTQAFANRQIDDMPEEDFQKLLFKLWSN